MLMHVLLVRIFLNRQPVIFCTQRSSMYRSKSHPVWQNMNLPDQVAVEPIRVFFRHCLPARGTYQRLKKNPTEIMTSLITNSVVSHHFCEPLHCTWRCDAEVTYW